MHKTFWLIALMPLLPVHPARALDAGRIKELAEAPHNRAGIIPELSIYPEARRYKVRMTTTMADPAIEPFKVEFEGTEKVVDGRYLVSEATPPGEDKPVIMVVTYDPKQSLFRKWVMVPNGEVIHNVGIADHELRTIAWSSVGRDGGFVGIERHTDAKTVWKDVLLKDGKVLFRTEGVAVKLE